MKLSLLFILVSMELAPAQNLGLGTGSRANPQADSLANRQGDNSPRKAQLGRRLGLLNRKSTPFDPKVYEARGKELHGQFYEIDGNANLTVKSAAKGEDPFGDSSLKSKSESRKWIYWIGAAGVAGISAGTAGLILLNQSHPSAGPIKYIDLTDEQK